MLLAACSLYMVAHASRAGSQNKKQATGPTSLQIAETAVSSRKNIYSACKAVGNIQQFSQLYDPKTLKTSATSNWMLMPIITAV